MRTGASRRRMAVWASAALLGAGLATAGAAGPAVAKKKHSANPLAGRWTGTTQITPTWSGPPAPISFQITKAGYVVNLRTTVTLDWSNNPPGCSSAPPVAVNMPAVRLNKPVPAFPKGKRFDYTGPYPLIHADGKVITARKMEGALLLRQVEISPGVKCGTGNVHYTVKRVGG